MAVQRTVTTNLGVATLDAGSHLEYTLKVSGANPVWNYACQHSVRKEVHDDPQPLYRWFLKTPSGPASDPIFQPDVPAGTPDVYLVAMSFAGGALTYKLLVMQQPANITIQEISYSTDDPTDSFREPLTVIAS